jgi:hypothetical protein
MFVHTDIPEAPWHVVESDDKRRARINMIAHLISTIPYRQVKQPSLKLPPRPPPRATSGRRATCRPTSPTTPPPSSPPPGSSGPSASCAPHATPPPSL